TRCDERLLASSRVRLVATATIGFDHIDRAWCAARGIEVATAAGCNARGVLQWVAAVLEHLSRTEGWHPSERTLGVVGVGHVGSLVKAYAEAWGFRTICCDPPREAREGCGFRPIGEVARAADILTFHTPLDATTRHLADAALLGAMKPGAAVLNSSRGPVVDGGALLRSGRTCCLDVWEGEPNLDAALLARAAIATPHVAGYSEQGKATATAMAVAAVARRFDLPLAGWYPAEAAPSVPRPIGWDELRATIRGAYDIAAESRELKAAPGNFERLRDNYRYRREYF
ncbi:MAG: 4-phosphoerythronate dehydrogenase, partial [Alistipes sp.]|nr:4-phosphoerythronate dehydrogenase [Alistipes sp.]